MIEHSKINFVFTRGHVICSFFYPIIFVSFRAAATRCREKRKIWVQQLEKKAEDLTNTNAHLQVLRFFVSHNYPICIE